MASSALKFIDKTKLPQLRNASLEAGQKALYKMAGFIVMSGRQSIRSRKKPSKPGMPFSRGTGALKKALGADRNESQGTVAIGYRFGHKTADLHELGGKNSQGNRYPRRSVLEPALTKGIADFSKKFEKDFQRYFKM